MISLQVSTGRTAGRDPWIRILSLALILGFGAFIVGCSTMDDVRAEESEPFEEPIVISADVLFDFDSSELRSESIGELNRVSDLMQDHPDTRIRIEGHTDSEGSESYNEGLSERRAQSVADYLANRNVSRDRMTVEGRGELDPVATNETSEGRQQNRRVEIHGID